MRVKMTSKLYNGHEANVKADDVPLWEAQGWVKVPEPKVAPKAKEDKE